MLKSPSEIKVNWIFFFCCYVFMVVWKCDATMHECMYICVHEQTNSEQKLVLPDLSES